MIFGDLAQAPQVSGSSSAAGLKSGQFNRIRNFEKANIEYRIMNVEYRSKAFYLILLKRLSKAKPHFDILRFDIRYSAVRSSNQRL
jgi:hypothetical protein